VRQYAGLADVLTKAFGVPAILADVLRQVRGISDAYIYGSWAARHQGQPGPRPVGATIREADWLNSGAGSFHETIVSRPMLRLAPATG
jgi:hypothetical protein